jgi:hypothetical protein
MGKTAEWGGVRFSAATIVFIFQAACYALNCVAPAPVSRVGILFGLLASCAGIYIGLRWSEQRKLARGLNCAAVSMVAMLFWMSQYVVADLMRVL